MAKTATIVASGAADDVKQFTYRARNGAGKQVTGVARATSKNDVTAELLSRGLVPLKVKAPASGGLLAAEPTLRKTAKKRDLVVATQSLAGMLEAGVELLRALDITIRGSGDPVLKEALTEARQQIQRTGDPLSKALADRGEVFPPMMVNLITAGEARNEVRQAMEQIAQQLDAEDRLRAKIKKAVTYPAIVFAMTGALFVFVMVFLVPKFAASFEAIGGPGTELPWPTRMVMTLGDAMAITLPVLLVVGVPSLLVYGRVRNRPRVRSVVDPWKYRVPVFGPLFQLIALSRFTRNLSGLLGAGVDRLESLEITAKTVGNTVTTDAILAVRDAQRRGQDLTAALEKTPLVPGVASELATVQALVEAGETGSGLPRMLGRAADLLDRDIDRKTDTMAQSLSPILMGFIGVIVAVLVIAIFLPYVSMFDLF